MAVDQTLKLEIRAVYESSNLSVAKVVERFKDCDVSPKTVEKWITKEKWEKNRFVDEKQAIFSLVENTLPIEDAKEIIKENLLKHQQSNGLSDEEIKKYGEILAKELCFDVLTAKSLQRLMGENILRAKIFADNSKSINTNAVFHNMLTTTVKTIYGEIKHINQTNNLIQYTDEQLQNMSNEELDRLIEG